MRSRDDIARPRNDDTRPRSDDARPRNDATRPRVGLLLGDPSGIGPEVAARLLAQPDVHDLADIVVLGELHVLEAGAKIANVSIDPRVYANLMPLGLVAPGPIDSGKPSAAYGRAVLAGLRHAADMVARGDIHGAMFAPLNKAAMRMGGLEHEDELRMLQDHLHFAGYVSEFNITGDLWTSRVTSHLPLREVAHQITTAGVCNAIQVIHTAQRQAGIEAPRIAVAGLNPHAGDNGTMGREEVDIIAPAIAQMRARGVDARGPFPADTLFIAARRGDYDAVVSMYHDQGQIAMKLMGFDSGVTVLGGLPIPIATPAHGTAYDIVGRGIASANATRQAFNIVTRMAIHRMKETQ